MYDIIGDTHGYADELVQLLTQLGYRETGGVFSHPDRTAVFCGDFIDRGPQIRDVLKIVRNMVDSGHAQAIIGNHEFNAIAFHREKSNAPGQYYRAHSERNKHQHQQTLQQLDADEMQDHLRWFATLPVCLDLKQFRVVHACWDPPSLEILQKELSTHSLADEDILSRATTPGTDLFDAVECVLKGPELKLPAGLHVLDKEGTKRTRTRIRWFELPNDRSWSEYCLPAAELPALTELQVPESCQPNTYPAEDPPVFFGHYWLQSEKPAPLAANVACVDYSVARGGHLAAYRFNGEPTLSADRFVTVPCREALRS